VHRDGVIGQHAIHIRFQVSLIHFPADVRRQRLNAGSYDRPQAITRTDGVQPTRARATASSSGIARNESAKRPPRLPRAR